MRAHQEANAEVLAEMHDDFVRRSRDRAAAKAKRAKSDPWLLGQMHLGATVHGSLFDHEALAAEGLL